jgi:hypothetical protein
MLCHATVDGRRRTAPGTGATRSTLVCLQRHIDKLPRDCDTDKPRSSSVPDDPLRRATPPTHSRSSCSGTRSKPGSFRRSIHSGARRRRRIRVRAVVVHGRSQDRSVVHVPPRAQVAEVAATIAFASIVFPHHERSGRVRPNLRQQKRRPGPHEDQQ